MKPSSLRAFVVVVVLGSPLARAQVQVDWVAPGGGVAIAVGAANDVYTVNHQRQLGAEMTLTRRDVNGNLVWQASFDQTDPTKWERASWVVVDGAGDVVVCGTLMSGFSNPVNAASIVQKFGPDGSLKWRRVYESGFDGSSTQRCLVDSANAIYVVGMGSGPAGFVAKVKKFAPDGTPVWTWFDAAGIGAPVRFKRTPDQHLLVAARSIFGSVNGYAKIDLAGNTVWSLTGVNSLTVGDVAGDSVGNAYVIHAENVVNGKTVVRKLSPTGTPLFQSVVPLSGAFVEVGPDDRPVIAGFPSQSAPGAAFAKLQPDGTLAWSNLDADGPLALLLHAQLIVDASNAAYLAAGTLFEMAVCKVDGAGSSVWTQTMSGSFAHAVARGVHDQSVFVVGGSTVRLLDPTAGPWRDLGRSLAGGAGAPLLYGSGELTAATTFALDVAQAPVAAPGLLVLGQGLANLPFLGGTLVPSPDVVVAIQSDVAGAWHAGGATPLALPPGAAVRLQTWFHDASAPLGASASNGLQATLP